MKKNQNNMALKALFVALLMSLGLSANAKEKQGVVLFKERVKGVYEDFNIHVYLDTDGDVMEDSILTYPERASAMIRALDRRINDGTIIIFDDEKVIKSQGFDSMRSDALCYVDGKGMFELFPSAEDNWFPYAPKRKGR